MPYGRQAQVVKKALTGTGTDRTRIKCLPLFSASCSYSGAVTSVIRIEGSRALRCAYVRGVPAWHSLELHVSNLLTYVLSLSYPSSCLIVPEVSAAGDLALVDVGV